MPELKRYTAPGVEISGATPRATGNEFGAQVGAGITDVGRGVLHVKTQIEEDEARTALVGASEIRTKYAKALDEATISGADTADLKQKMNDELSKLGETFWTKRGQQSLALHTSQNNLMFDDQANRIAVTKAAETARVQGQQFLQDASKLLRSNPSALSIVERNADELVDTFSLMPPEKKALVKQDLKTQLNMAAVMASARIDPEGTKKRLIDGEWSLDPRQREQGVAETETQMRAIRADEIHKRQLADYEERKRHAEESNNLLTKIYKGSLAPGEIANSALPREIRENLSRFQAWLSEYRANKPHPAALMELWTAIHAPSDDPRKIYNNDMVFRFAEQGKINAKEAELASTWVAAQKDENNVKFMSRLQGKLSTIKAGMTADPKWAAQGELSAAVQMEIATRADARAKELRRENKDPALIFDPDSKEFMFRQGLLTSVANDIQAQHRNLILPKFSDPNDPALKALPPGTHFQDGNGVERIVPKPVGVAPTAQHATALDIQAGYIENIPRSNSVRINAPPKSPAHKLQGKTYASREAALEALKALQ